MVQTSRLSHSEIFKKLLSRSLQQIGILETEPVYYGLGLLHHRFQPSPATLSRYAMHQKIKHTENKR